MASLRRTCALVALALLPRVEAATLLRRSEQAAAVTPMEKVTTLLEELKAEVESEGRAEAMTYEAFACFCKANTLDKSETLRAGQDLIGSYSSMIELGTANKNTESTELQERKETQEDRTAELEATQVRCAKEEAAYEATAADLSKALSSLASARTALATATPAKAAAGEEAVLLALHAEPVKRALALADALSLPGAKGRKAVSAFLQRLDVPSADPEYKFKSQGVIDTIDQLLVEFKDEKSTLDGEWSATKESCDDTKKSLADEMSSNLIAINSIDTAISDLAGQIADNRGFLVQKENVLKDDQLYLRDLTERCEARAKDWDQRSQMRAGELTALSGALTLLRSNVTAADAAVNKRALLLQLAKRTGAAPAVFQGAKAMSFLQEGSFAARAKQHKVECLLRAEGQRLGSVALSTMATSVAGDPFAKVKDLIQKLVERLLAESTAEASKKSFCDEEMGTATQDRDFRHADSLKLNAEIAQLESKEDSLEESTASLQAAVVSLEQELVKATSLRAAELAANVAAIKQAREGVEALAQALAILKNFYKQAGKAAALMQVSPVDEDTSGPGFEGAYAGKQEASTGIIGLLEVIMSDFERTIRTTEASEEAALREHVEFDRASKTDISGKSTQNKLELEELGVTVNALAQKMADLQTAVDLTGLALARLEDLKPTCVDLTMPYEIRVQKREEEVVALKRAVCILDPDRVEADCLA